MRFLADNLEVSLNCSERMIDHVISLVPEREA